MANQVIYTASLTNASYVGSGAGMTGLGGFSNVQTFTGSGTTPAPFTWRKPSTGNWLRVECIGAGGSNCGGGGGCTVVTIPMASVPGSTVAVVAGGGTAFPASPSGINAPNSTFGPYGPGGTITGYGGATNPISLGLGGGGGGSTAAASGSTGGGSDGGPGSGGSPGIIFGGGGGGRGPFTGGTSVYGGGGGSGVTGGASVFGGAGGSGPLPGVIPGGGGGPNANGAAGQVRVIVF